MTRRENITALTLGIGTAFAVALLGAVTAATTTWPPPKPEAPTMNRVDHPRCFPEGTIGPEGFPGCPDNPSERSV